MTMIRVFRDILLTVAVSVLATGCGHDYFHLARKDYVIKPGSLAVISGDKSSASLGLAGLLTAELQHRSIFRVLSQEEITKKIPHYTDELPEAKNDHDAVVAMHKKLRTDYLFVVWSECLNKGVTTTRNFAMIPAGWGKLQMDISGVLVNSPDEAEVGISYFRAKRSLGITSVDYSSSDNAAAAKILQSAAESIADDFIDITRSGKPRGEQK